MRVTIEGGDELARKLHKLPGHLRGKYLQDALEEGGKRVVAEASARAPRRPGSGYLATHITSEIVRKGPRAELDVGPERGAWYAHFVELGTRRSRARPFLRPALRARKGDVLRRFGARLRQHLERMARL
jgi:HK97 gp10 family phage protein